MVHFPPNTISRLQPMDAGIIQSVKLHYRKRMLRYVLKKMDKQQTASELCETINVLDANNGLLLA